MYPRFGELTFVTPYGLMLVAGLLTCWLYARRRAPRFGVDASHIDLALPMVFATSILLSHVIGVVGSGNTLFAAGSFAARTHLSLFGLLSISVPALYAYSRVSGLSAGKMLDLFALPVLVCLMLTRLGCFLAGCCWGDLAWSSPQLAGIGEPAMTAQVFTLPWLPGEITFGAVSFPAGSFAWRQHLELGLIGKDAAGSLHVYPIQLYELILIAAQVLVFRRLEHRWTTPGVTMLVVLGSYALLRFFIEFLRADSTLVAGYLTATQLICIVLFIACAAYLIFTLRYTGRMGRVCPRRQ